MPRAWTLAAAVAAAVTGYAYAVRHGAPEPIASIASIGTSAVEARGGVVLEIHVDEGPASARDEVADVVEKRLAAGGADVTIEDVDARTIRAHAAGIGTSGAQAIATGLGLRGLIGLREEIERGSDVDQVAGVRTVGVRVERDSWYSEDGRSHVVPYLAAADRAPLTAATAQVTINPANEVLVEELAPTAHAAHEYRTHVVARRPVIENGDIAAAETSWDPQTNRAVVNLTFSQDATQRFGDWTEAHIGDKLAIVVDGAVWSSPVINGAIRGGKAMITMGAGDPADQEAQARALANALRAQAILPVPVTARVAETFEASSTRTQLARVLCALAAALVALAIGLGFARWRALEVPAAPARVGGPVRWGALAARVAVTLGVPAVLWMIRDLSLPGVDGRRLDQVAAPRAAATVGALGVGAVIVAYLLGELAALAVPAWRARRDAGRDARVPIVAAVAAIATVLVIAQAYVLGRVFVFLDAASSPWPAAAALTGGVAALALGAAAIERWGLGNGWSVVIAALVLHSAAADLADADGAAIALDAGAGALVAIVSLAAVRSSLGGVRLPIAGFAGAALLPGALALLLVQLAIIPGAMPAAFDVRDRLGQPAAVLFIAAAFAAVLAVPWSRRAIGARGAAAAASVAIAVGLTAIALVVRDAAHLISVLAIAIAAAAIADVIAEARARARAAWIEIAQTSDVDHAAEAVAGGALARGLHVRALGRFFVPFAPVVVYRATDDGA